MVQFSLERRLQLFFSFKKINRSPYLGSDLTNHHKIWHDYAQFSSEPRRPLEIRIFENTRWRTAAIFRGGSRSSSGSLWMEVPNWVQGRIPGRRSRGQVPQKVMIVCKLCILQCRNLKEIKPVFVQWEARGERFLQTQ